jgi:hypothetical protein
MQASQVLHAQNGPLTRHLSTRSIFNRRQRSVGCRRLVATCLASGRHPQPRRVKIRTPGKRGAGIDTRPDPAGRPGPALRPRHIAYQQ